MQSSEQHLATVPNGATAFVTAVALNRATSSRLMELGFVPGEEVTVLRRAPFGGPLLCHIRGTSIGLRVEEAQCVHVQTVKSPLVVRNGAMMNSDPVHESSRADVRNPVPASEFATH
ncbi:MAG: FeoA family protein [Planctomycetaceae bacterium]